MLRDLIIQNRSYRRFDESVKIPEEKLKDWIELARLSASGRNVQPLKYVICTDELLTKQIFQHLGWAGYLTKWQGPAEGERPVAYIVMLHDKSVSENRYCDDGIAAQSILLGAAEEGFGGCIIGTVNKGRVGKLLKLPENLEILWVLALGKPTERVVVENAEDGNIRYWRDDEDVHHVPKRPLEELIFKTV